MYDGTSPTPPYAVACEAFLREPTWCPTLPLATQAPCGWGRPRLPPPPLRDQVKPVRTPVAILGSLGVCIYVPASRHWLISYSPIHLT